MNKPKTVITVSRYWKNPQIMHVIWKDGISLTMDMEDFKDALIREVGQIVIKEIGSITFRIRNKKYQTDLSAAIAKDLENSITNIIEKIKEDSAKIV